jgi:hypothetical protein
LEGAIIKEVLYAAKLGDSDVTVVSLLTLP